MLNLVTPLFRKNNIHNVFSTIPKQDDILWWIVYCKNRTDLYEDIKIYENNKFIKIIAVDLEEDNLKNLHIKMNTVLIQVKGFFQCIDDDNAFHPNSYQLYFKHKENYKMIIGKSIRANSQIYCQPNLARGGIDGGQAIIHSDCFTSVLLQDFTKDNCADGSFLIQCYQFCGEENVIILDEVSAYYNYFI